MRIVWVTLLTVVAALTVALIPMSAAADHGADHGREDFDNPAVFITTENLAELVKVDLDVRILDLRPAEQYEAGRIPFAMSLPNNAVLDPNSRISGARISDDELAQVFGALGIGGDSFVVIYDDQGGHLAARLFWIFQYLGHQKVSVLDGGFPKWEREERFISTAPRPVKSSVFPIDRTQRRLATAEWILENRDNPDVVIVDVRPVARYEESHVPGAINMFWKGNLTDEDAWQDAGKLREAFESAGVTKDKEIVVYCQGGNHNGHTYLTLKALGYSQVRSYDRAWPEWGTDPTLPVIEGGLLGSFSDVLTPISRTDSSGTVSTTSAASRTDGTSNLEIGLIAAMAALGLAVVVMGAGLWRLSRKIG